MQEWYEPKIGEVFGTQRQKYVIMPSFDVDQKDTPNFKFDLWSIKNGCALEHICIGDSIKELVQYLFKNRNFKSELRTVVTNTVVEEPYEYCYKVVGLGNVSCSNIKLKLAYQLNEKTIGKYGPIFVFKELSSATNFAHMRSVSVYLCKCSNLTRLYSRLYVDEPSNVIKKFWNKKDDVWEINHECREISNTPDGTYQTNWVIPIKKIT